MEAEHAQPFSVLPQPLAQPLLGDEKTGQRVPFSRSKGSQLPEAGGLSPPETSPPGESCLAIGRCPVSEQVFVALGVFREDLSGSLTLLSKAVYSKKIAAGSSKWPRDVTDQLHLSGCKSVVPSLLSTSRDSVTALERGGCLGQAEQYLGTGDLQGREQVLDEVGVGEPHAGQ